MQWMEVLIVVAAVVVAAVAAAVAYARGRRAGELAARLEVLGAGVSIGWRATLEGDVAKVVDINSVALVPKAPRYRCSGCGLEAKYEQRGDQVEVRCPRCTPDEPEPPRAA